MPVGVYISVPFCRTKCSFCNFASDVFSRSAYENYVVRVIEEIADAHRHAAELGCALPDTADSIYLGGGTPSILEPSQLARIFAEVCQHFSLTRDCEITVECAPGTITPALIGTLVQCGVNRISLGVQSFVDQEAKSVGRLHTRAIVLEEIQRLRNAGLGNISIDLIAGLPHQTGESWKYSVAETIATSVPHASVYMLEVDDESRLGSELIAGGARYHAHFVPDDDTTAEFYETACEALESAGVAQYEISNFARMDSATGKNYQSRHNLKYWTRDPYIGFGVDAHSMQRADDQRASSVNPTANEAVRFATPDSLESYMNRDPHTLTPVDEEAALEEKFFLGLRLNRGIDLESLRSSQKHAANSENREGLDLSHTPRGESPEGPDITHAAERENREGHDFSRAAEAPAKAALAAEADNHLPGALEAAIRESIEDGLLEQQNSVLRLTARGRLLSNEVFARFLRIISGDRQRESTLIGR